MKLSLVMVTAEGTAREFPVPSLPVTIGRAEDAKVRIPLASISRKHAELLDDDDELVVKDLGSSNGTYVNGERVKRRELVPGDLLCVGPVVFVVRIDGHPKDIDASASYSSGSSGAAAAGAAQPAIAGVPTWSGTAPNASAAAAEAPARATAPTAPKAPSNPAPPAAASKPVAKKNDDDIDSLLSDLSESDFDIDFSDLDDDKPKPAKG